MRVGGPPGAQEPRVGQDGVGRHRSGPHSPSRTSAGQKFYVQTGLQAVRKAGGWRFEGREHGTEQLGL